MDQLAKVVARYRDQRAASAMTAIERIKADVFQANYPAALEKSAELIKDENLGKKAEAIRTLYRLQKGPQSKHLLRYIGELTNEVLIKAERLLDAEDYEALKLALGEMPL